MFIEELELGVAAYNVLKRANVNTFSDLLHLSDDELDAACDRVSWSTLAWKRRVRDDVHEAQARARQYFAEQEAAT